MNFRITLSRSYELRAVREAAKMSDGIKYTGNSFEDEVRNIARILWSKNIGQGSESVYGRERDGIFDNGEVIYVVEATTKQTKDKAEYDAKKTHDLVRDIRKNGNLARGFVVTLNEPTPDQKSVVKKYQQTTEIISFDELRSKLFDSRQYIVQRAGRPFGSVYDYASSTYNVPRNEFIEPSMVSVDQNDRVSLRQIIDKMDHGFKSILIAEYGIGKSMLLREVFFKLSEQYNSKKRFKVPVYINLREHLGQTNHIELLERHARNIGFSQPNQLVAAWGAGYVDLLIDGFDELSTRGWSGDARRLRELRRTTHTVVRNLIKETPSSVSVLIAGRAGYFDSITEMRHSLGTSDDLFEIIQLISFDDTQVRRYLEKKGLLDIIPAWVPTRPLLLGYLASKGMLKEICTMSTSSSHTRGQAWYQLLGMIAKREADQLEGTDPETILLFFGRLATLARQSPGGLGNFSPFDIETIFFHISGKTPIDDDRNLLLRLPGLGASSDSDANRSLVDQDFADAASAIEVFSYILHPYQDLPEVSIFEGIQGPLGPVGLEVVSYLLDRDFVPLGKLNSSMGVALSNSLSQLAYDIFLIGANSDSKFLTFDGISVGTIDLSGEEYLSGKIDFSKSMIDHVVVPDQRELNEDIFFTECLIGTIEGRISESDLPVKQFIDCEISSFKDEYKVNSDVLTSNLPNGIKVLIITLRKLWIQSGAGRLESALLRGLDQNSRQIAPEIIKILTKHKFIYPTAHKGRTVWHPTRDMRQLSLEIMNAPNSVEHGIIEECRAVSR